MTALTPEHERPVRPNYLFGRERQLFDRPAVTVETPQRLGRDWQGGREHERLLVARVVDHSTAKRWGSWLGGREHQVLQTWACIIRLATTHWVVASGGVAAIVLPLRVRGKGRTRSP